MALRDRALNVVVLVCAMTTFAVTAARAGDVPFLYWRLAHEERYVFRNDMERMNWREIRERREMNRTAGQEIKTSELNLYARPVRAGGNVKIAGPLAGRVSLVVRDPNARTGTVSCAGGELCSVRLPHDAGLNGRYLLGALYSPGRADVDGDGRKETVWLSAKQMIRHYRHGGVTGRASVVFFDDPERIPLEIGPVINTAENRSGGATLWPHKAYEMQVRYRGSPLPGARVTIHAMGSGWEKTLVTDAGGMFTVIPTDDRADSDREWQTYLFMVGHHDRERSQFHASTLPVTVYRNRPEWYSTAMGFTFFSIVGTAVLVVILAWLAWRGKRRERHQLAVFETYRIKEDV